MTLCVLYCFEEGHTTRAFSVILWNIRYCAACWNHFCQTHWTTFNLNAIAWQLKELRHGLGNSRSKASSGSILTYLFGNTPVSRPNVWHVPVCKYIPLISADSRFAPSRWETSLQGNARYPILFTYFTRGQYDWLLYFRGGKVLGLQSFYSWNRSY